MNPILSGLLLEADGTPAANAFVGVAAVLDVQDGMQKAVPLAGTYTDSAGFWAVQDLVNIPVESFSNIEVTGTVTDQPVIFGFVATRNDLVAAQRPAADHLNIPGAAQDIAGSNGPVLIMQVGHGLVSTGNALSSMPTAVGDGTETSTAADEDFEYSSDDVGPNDSTAEEAVEPTGTGPCLPNSYWYVNLNKYKSVFIPLKVSKTLGKSTLRYHYKVTKHTDSEVAITGSGGNYAGGFSNSQQEQSETGVSPDWPNNTSKLVKAKWKFRKQQRYCLYESGTGPEAKPTNVFRWTPYEFADYTKRVANNPTFACGTQGPVHSRVTYTETVTTVWTHWFEIAGVKLSNKQTQADQTGLTINPDEGQTPRYCGSSSNGLRYSAFIREIPN